MYLQYYQRRQVVEDALRKGGQVVLAKEPVREATSVARSESIL